MEVAVCRARSDDGLYVTEASAAMAGALCDASAAAISAWDCASVGSASTCSCRIDLRLQRIDPLLQRIELRLRREGRGGVRKVGLRRKSRGLQHCVGSRECGVVSGRGHSR